MAEELEGWAATDAPIDGYASEGELNTRKMIINLNKKKKNKKSGGFQSMGLGSSVFRGIMKKGYKIPTPIQRKTIPIILEGKDVVAMARTGSGKTACFLIPLFDKLQSHSAQTGARALILSPTRELALQTLKFTKELGRFTGLRAAVVLGGDSLEGQFASLHENPDIIIATPGRLVHVCVEMNLKLKSVEYVVFDEADRLYELGFAEQLSEILGRLPEVRQTLLFSATLPKMLVEFARAGLTDPVLIRLDTEHVLSENLRLAFFKVSTEDKLGLLLHLLQYVISHREQTVIFAATKHHVEYLHMALELANIPNTYCYSALDASARKINIAKFQTKKVRCLLVTDVAARGIDIPLLDNVINFNFPGTSKLFIHRVGRVARAGRRGVAYSFIAADEAAYLLDLHLFLCKELRFAPHPPDNSKMDDWDFIYGSVPQTILDNEAEQVFGMHRNSHDLDNMKKTSQNAFMRYCKSRPIPSTESVRRMKESEWLNNIGYHPLLLSNQTNLEHQRVEMLHALKTLQPRGTVFEMIKTKKEAHRIAGMKEKRLYDDKRITTFHRNVEESKAAKLEKEAETEQVREQVTKMEQSTEDEMKRIFTSVIGPKQKNGKGSKNASSANKNLMRKENQTFKDKEFYIPYTKSTDYTEKGLSISGIFSREIQAAALDIVGDDDTTQRQATNLHKWDRVKKRFVGTQNHQKRIKTESGVWIASSYKTNRYQKWIASGNNKATDNSDEEDDSQAFPSNKGRGKNFIAIRNQSYGKTHPLLAGQKKSRQPPKREMRTKDEIIKETKRRDIEHQKTVGGTFRNKQKKAKSHKRQLSNARKKRDTIQAKMSGHNKGLKGKGRK